jgi:hypothetical protein
LTLDNCVAFLEQYFRDITGKINANLHLLGCKHLAKAEGEDDEETAIVVGVRIWF